MRKIIAGNWKMYKIRSQAAQVSAKLAESLGKGTPSDRLVIVFPSFTSIPVVSEAFSGAVNLAVGGQNFYPAREGAFTGEVSPEMLHDCGAAWALVGHSERRHVLGESDELIARKTESGLKYGLKIMLCIGETLQERESGELEKVLERQLVTALSPVVNIDQVNVVSSLAIAYEPVWAIGTGKVAGPAEVLDAHAVTRKILNSIFGSTANSLPILYGGSVKPDNAGTLIGLDNVDGLLVGGASLEADSFLKIVNA